ncbi:CaiB/BaiF CoA transferase family protein [Rhodococcus koreensis]|uniref:CaiB/BaiF CoA transferase family protein n=1 Tax=Rhodococcus koreensis TaxID=99653 RepID=UPI0021004EEE|nr:CoA transferase [Rhodococcus koreensis]
MTVVDMSTSYAGPTTSMYLADLGATVIKLERVAGDEARGWGPPFVDGKSAWFAAANRNKRSVALNLKSEDGREVLFRILADADVFVESMNPVKLTSLGIDPETLCARFPQLVYCALSGFGSDGPHRDRPGYDLVAQARSGLMSVTGARGGAPQRVSTALSDIATAMSAAMAINAALVRRFREGIGDVVDVSLFETDLALMAPRIASFHAGEVEPTPSGGTDSVLAVYQPFETADRSIVVAIGNDDMWKRFAYEIGLDALANDPELATNAHRQLGRERIRQHVARVLATEPASVWIERLTRVNVPVSAVQTLSEVVQDSQVQFRGSLLSVPGSEGSMVTVRSPFRLGSVPEPRNERFPELGAHTYDVMCELGFADADIERMASDGSIYVSNQTTPVRALS